MITYSQYTPNPPDLRAWLAARNPFPVLRWEAETQDASLAVFEDLVSQVGKAVTVPLVDRTSCVPSERQILYATDRKIAVRRATFSDVNHLWGPAYGRLWVHVYAFEYAPSRSDPYGQDWVRAQTYVILSACPDELSGVGSVDLDVGRACVYYPNVVCGLHNGDEPINTVSKRYHELVLAPPDELVRAYRRIDHPPTVQARSVPLFLAALDQLPFAYTQSLLAGDHTAWLSFSGHPAIARWGGRPFWDSVYGEMLLDLSNNVLRQALAHAWTTI